MKTKDRWISPWLRRAGFIVMWGWAGMADLHAQTPVDLEALIQETQRMSQSPDELTLVWWLPEEFWAASLAQDPSLDKDETEVFLSALRPYTLIVVVDGRVGNFGSVTYHTEATVRSNLVLKDDQGVTYSPLSNDAVDAETKSLLQIMKPLIGNTLGPLGQNMHFVLFQSNQRKAIVDARKTGALRVFFREKEFKFRLPLGSVLPPKYDAQTRERFPGNYSFNPFTGKPLVN